MRLWKTPERLRRIALLLYVAFPLAFLASLISRRMSWWQWEPLREWPWWAGFLAILSVMVLCVLRARRGVYAAILFIASASTLTFLGLSVRQENVGLGLFSVALGIIAYAYVDRLGSALETPAIRPGIRWFQTLPEPIPGLSVDWGDRKNLRLSKLDLDGCFILGSFPRGAEKILPGDILLHYRGCRMGCDVRIVASLPSKIDSSWAGIGVEFKNSDRDTRKELSDFIEVLRGEGHVST